MRWFTVLKAKDQAIQEYLDALVFLCNPGEKNPAHITLRGPYQDRPQPVVADDLYGSEVTVQGVGNFFSETQNTVFLRCDSPLIRKYWYKRDYGYNPHITLYDGTSRDFAERLRLELNFHRLYFTFRAGVLEAVPSWPGQKDFALVFGLNAQRVAEASGLPLEIQEAAKLPEWQRLTYISRICSKLMYSAQNGALAAY